jgi:hypothetical protein
VPAESEDLRMKTTSLVSGLFCLAFLSNGAFAQDVFVYESVDENGVTTFSDVPPAEGEAALTDMRSRRTDPNAVQAQVAAMNETYSEVTQTDADRNAVAAENKQIETKNAQIRQQNCQEAQARRQRYTDARRLYRPTEDGGRDYLTSEELEEQWAEVDQMVKEWCGGQ